MPSIRNARQDDAEELAAVGFRAWESAVHGWLNAEPLRANALRAFLDFTQEHYLAIDLVEKGGQVTAWAARENFDNKITDLWVDPVWHGQGHGTMLLERVEQDIHTQGYANATLETHSENSRAIDFLRKRGYGISWMTAAWSPKLDREVDTVGLVKQLAPAVAPDSYSEF